MELSTAARPCKRAQHGSWRCCCWRAACAPWSQQLLAIVLAQVLSAALAVTGVCSQLLADQGVHVPTAQAAGNYVLLACCFGTCWLVRRPGHAAKQQHQHLQQQQQQQAQPQPQQHQPQQQQLGRSTGSQAAARPAASTSVVPAGCRTALVFAALAFVDVEANVLVTTAYSFTSLTSVTLLDSFTIPAVMALSWLALRARYRPGHFAGAACCMAGLAVLVVGDALLGRAAAGSAGAGRAPLLGDALVVAGALLYAASNVAQELLLDKDVPATQLLALLGAFGALISGTQALLLERDALVRAPWGSLRVAAPMAGFAVALFVFYSLVPRVLVLGGAALLNLSLLTSDAWAALARLLLFQDFGSAPAAVFGASLLLVAGGLVLYARSGSPTHDAHKGQGYARLQADEPPQLPPADVEARGSGGGGV